MAGKAGPILMVQHGQQHGAFIIPSIMLVQVMHVHHLTTHRCGSILMQLVQVMAGLGIPVCHRSSYLLLQQTGSGIAGVIMM